MRKLNMRKGFIAVAITVILTMMMSVNAFAATKEIVKDGEFQNTGFVNAGELKDGTIEGPGNWTQLNLGDATVDAPYLHVILKATGDTAKAQIAVSDSFTFNLADLGITLTEEFQDVVLPVEEKGITMLSWLNVMGLDGGSSIYNVKDVFLSDSAEPTLKAEAAAEEAPAAVEVPAGAAEEAPKTGNSNMVAVLALAGMAGCAAVMAGLKKYKRVLIK